MIRSSRLESARLTLPERIGLVTSRPGTGRLCLDRRLIVISPSIGGAEKGPCTSYSPIHEHWTELTEGLDVSSVSIIEDIEGRVLYRVGLARTRRSDPTSAKEIRNARFDGVPLSGPAVYFDAATGSTVDRGDREIALGIGSRWIGDSGARLEGAELVTRFGPTYDFRNKRLPVWRLDYGEPVFASVFVDTATSGVADVLEDSDRPERFVFAFLHKWNFLFPLGRGVQSTVVATVVGLAMFLLGGTGFILNRRLRKRAGREAV